MKVEGLVFAGIGSADYAGVAGLFADLLAGYGFRYRHFRAPDGRRFELLERLA